MIEVDKYIQQFPENVQDILKEIRKLITDNALVLKSLWPMGCPDIKHIKNRWFTLLRSRTISVFMPHQQVTPNSKANFRNINKVKVRCSFLLMSLSRTIL